MTRKILNLNEELKRIKSLFTEERMYGNINEDVNVPECQCDDPKGENYGKLVEETNVCDPELCESEGESEDNTNKPTSVVPKGFVELTDTKKTQITGDENDSLEFYETKVVGSKTYVKRMDFIDIKSLIKSINKPKAGRDLDYVKKTIKDNDGKLVELYVSNESDLQFFKRKDGKVIRKNIKQDVKSDSGIIDNNIDSCKDHLRAMYRAWDKGAGPGDLEEFGFEPTAYKSVERCMANFYNRFEDNEKIMTMVNSFKQKKLIGDYRSGEGSISKGVEGEKYNVKDTRGNVVGTIKKITGNQYKFNGKRGYTFLKQRKDPQTSEITNTFTQSAQDSVYRALNLKYSTHDITVKEVDNDLNDCKFRIEPK